MNGWITFQNFSAKILAHFPKLSTGIFSLPKFGIRIITLHVTTEVTYNYGVDKTLKLLDNKKFLEKRPLNKIFSAIVLSYKFYA